MNKKKIFVYGMIFLFSILFISLISAETFYCCERLKNDGAWCQNAASTECATGTNPLTNAVYKKVATSCESTSYCQLGTCINSIEGTCMPNTPQIVCNNNNKGVWKAAKINDLPECQVGCCLVGNQAALVTLTKCKKLSSLQGLTTNYRSDIANELECIASITSDEKGACVFEKEFQRSCLMTTQRECSQIKAATYTGEENVEGITRETVEFHGGFLCSASQLETICGLRGGTACIDEQAYFLDTCGNPANVYDSSKLNDNNYWTYIQNPSCDDAKGNKNSKTCGACDYFSGSICKAYNKNDVKSIKPTYGNSFCGSLDCSYNGKNYLHGETWCVDNSKSALQGKNLPGSRYFRFMCYNGEVIPEPCSEFRNEICVQNEIGDYSNAKCVLNRWQTCTLMNEKDKCEDVDLGDCKWISGYSILKDVEGKDLGLTPNEKNCSALSGVKQMVCLLEPKTVPGSCVPKYAPGFDTWNGEASTGSELCGMASSACVVMYEVGILRDRDRLKTDREFAKDHCIENCQCIPGTTAYSSWLKTMNSICSSLGDCGNNTNYLGYAGYPKDPVVTEFTKKVKQ